MLRRVIAELEWEQAVVASHIGVACENGVIPLTGHVNSYPEKFAAETADTHILAVDVVGPKSAVVRLTAANVDAARAVRQHFADAPALRGWRIDFELVTMLK